MKILFCVRHNFHDSPGGAQIQIIKTIEYLEKHGVDFPWSKAKYSINKVISQ